MLKYLIAVSGGLASAACLLGLLYAYVRRTDPGKGLRILQGGIAVGAVAAVVMSYMKNRTSLVHTGLWNMRIFMASTVLLCLFLICLLLPLRARKPKECGLLSCVLAALLAALLLFYALPDIYAYPFIFRSLYSESVFSTSFMYRLIGYLFGVVLSLLSFFAAWQVAEGSPAGLALGVTVFALCVNAFQQICKTLSTMMTRRMIPVSDGLFDLVVFTSNHSNWFIYGCILPVAVLALLLVYQSLHAREPYDNPAQYRRIRRRWRDCRRVAGLLLFCCLCTVLNLTVLYAIDNREVQLSPAEEYTVEGENIYVSLAQVEDGHLHRFAYTTASGIETRFIIVKKPNSSAYGIGLDACDICGETGYYERDGQVVCKLCDVVMNINTIGFKGGCNPIPIDYSIGDGFVIIPISTLVEHEKEFK